ncbi:MAG: hypothetical protein ACE5J5_05735 [Candidatus Hydrothermarchaeales archaeon]
MKMIEIEGLEKLFFNNGRKVTALKDLSFEVNENEFITELF